MTDLPRRMRSAKAGKSILQINMRHLLRTGAKIRGAIATLMRGLHKQLAAAKLEYEQTALKRQIAATDRQIDQLIYEMYGLREEEIKIMEEGRQQTNACFSMQTYPVEVNAMR